MTIELTTNKLDNVVSFLYDLALTIGSESSVKSLLARALQRLLYHTSFPVGFICPTPHPLNHEAHEIINVAITAAAGSLRLIKAVDTSQPMPKAIFLSKNRFQENVGPILDSMLGKRGHYTCFLRLKIPEYGFVFLIGSHPPENYLPPTHMFDPILAHLSRAITLCAANDAQKNSLISERDELVSKQRLAAKMLDSINSGIFVTDANRVIIYVNGAFETMTKYEASFIIGKHPRHFFLKENNLAAIKSFSKKIDENDNWIGEINVTNKDGYIFPAWLMFSAIRDNDGEITNYMGIFTDISEKKETEERLNFLAFHDSLTKLPNLASFKEKIGKKIAMAEFEYSYLFLLSINIDNFNTINNSLGYSVGDELLIDFSKRLLESLRESDIVSRPGSDSFLVMLSGIRNRKDIETIARKILFALSKPITVEGVDVSVTSTIGISVFPDHGRDFDTLYKHADTALKYAKASERGYYKLFADSMDKVMHERFSIENQLRFALERNELTLYYQPFVDFKTNRVIGVEALLRWENPSLGRVSPGSFIPVAEQSGLIIPIGEWVLMQACKQWAIWRENRTPVKTVAVNISAVQFRRIDISEIVLKYLKLFGMSPKNLELELTESIMIHNTDQSLKTVAALKKIGVDLSLDDFGTGYSSFSYLSRFSIDKLKIDQSFVRDMTINTDAAKIVKAIVDIGKSLGLITIAEGIETAKQGKLLKKFGCDIAQGYFYCHPLPADELTKIIDSNGYLIK